jgi:hypothetical protein
VKVAESSVSVELDFISIAVVLQKRYLHDLSEVISLFIAFEVNLGKFNYVN